MSFPNLGALPTCFKKEKCLRILYHSWCKVKVLGIWAKHTKHWYSSINELNHDLWLYLLAPQVQQHQQDQYVLAHLVVLSKPGFIIRLNTSTYNYTRFNMDDINISCLSLQNLVVQLHRGGPSVPPGLSALVAPLDLVLLSEGGKTQPMFSFFLLSSSLHRTMKMILSLPALPLVPLGPSNPGWPICPGGPRNKTEVWGEFISSVGRKKASTHLLSVLPGRPGKPLSPAKINT